MTTDQTSQESNQPADQSAAPDKQTGRPADVEALRRENERLRDDMRKAAAERDAAREKARGEVDEQVTTILSEYSALKEAALRDKQRAIDSIVSHAIPEPLRPMSKTILAGLRAQDPDLAVKIDADVDALAAKYTERLTEQLKDIAVPSQASHGNPSPAAPKTTPPDWRQVKDPKELRALIKNQL